MAFDPDAYAGMTAAGFDPDAYVRPAPAAHKPEPGWTERAKVGVRQFFDPGYTPERPGGGGSLGDVGRQALKGASFFAGPALGGAMYAAGSGGGPGEIAVGAAGGHVIGKYLPKAMNAAGEWLGTKAIDKGRRALSGVMNTLARRKPIPEEAVREALDIGAIKPLGTVTGAAERLRAAADPLAEKYSAILNDLASKGVHGPEAEALASKMASEATQAANNSIIGTRAGALQSTADALREKALPVSGQGRLGLMQAELMKRELQTAAKNDFVREGADSLAGTARKELAGTFKDAIEQSVAEQASKAPEAAAAFVPVKEKLHNTLTALGSAAEGAARRSRRSDFGLHEAMGLASGLASGNPVEAATATGIMHAIKDRGASTSAWTYDKIAKALKAAAPASGATSPVMGSEAAALADAIRRRLGGPTLVPAVADEETAK